VEKMDLKDRFEIEKNLIKIALLGTPQNSYQEGEK